MRLAFSNSNRSGGIPFHSRSSPSHRLAPPRVYNSLPQRHDHLRTFNSQLHPRVFSTQASRDIPTITSRDIPTIIQLNKMSQSVPSSTLNTTSGGKIPPKVAKPSSREKMNQYLENRPWIHIGKLYISTAVWTTAIIPYFIYACSHGFSFATMLETLFGMGLITYSAAIFNQIIEVKQDALMKRTENRPLVKERIPMSTAMVVGTISGITGITLLFLASMWAGIVGTINLGLYAFVYSKMKTVSAYNTHVGAICGALPALIGPLAAGASITNPAIWFLFFFMFFWQFPHAMALYQMNNDLEKAGIVMVGRDKIVPLSWQGVYGIDALVILTSLGCIAQFGFISWASFLLVALGITASLCHTSTTTFANQLDANGKTRPIKPEYGISVKEHIPGQIYMRSLWPPLFSAIFVSSLCLLLN
eukprot:TRINITY_DN1965_c0_g1_i1.p1 TRINITY_DN1965_c0_g1~~TRINITY_DN1965_c0_g1_i1.p1  ORF type:complete len:418 (-),score=56.66 TRINITY_DN1965_c0_g1_i1:49-1302(-)